MHCMNSYKNKRKGLNAALLLLILVLMLFSPVVSHAAEDDPGNTGVSTETSVDSEGSGDGTGTSDSSAEQTDSDTGTSDSSAEQTDSGTGNGTSDSSAEQADSGTEQDDSSVEQADSGTEQDDSSVEQADSGTEQDDSSVKALGGGVMLMSEPETTVTGEGTDAGVTADQTTTDNTRTTADYEIPAGSAYVAGSESTVYENTASENAIQQAVNAAIASAQQSITIVVNDGVYSGGITVIGTTASQDADGTTSESGTNDNSIILKVIAHDALVTTEDDQGNEVESITAGSAGGVQVEGDLSFSNLQVLLAGIYLSLQNKVTVTNANTVEYYGTAADDNVTLELNNVKDKATIDLGDGNDTLDATVTQSPTITIDLGASGSTIFQGSNLTDEAKTAITNGIKDGIAELTGGSSNTKDVRLSVEVIGGNGDDELTIKLVNSTDITVPDTSGGAITSLDLSGVTNAKIDLDLSATDLAIEGNSGADVITVEGGMKLGIATIVTQPILNALYSGVTELSKNSAVWDTALLPGTTVKANGGTGDDVFNIDTTVAFSTFRGTEATINGGSTGGAITSAGFDRTHITGKIGDGYVDGDDEKISGTKDCLVLDALAEISVLNDATSISKLFSSLIINNTNIDALTDNLKGKTEVNGTMAELAGQTFQSFTDYIISDYNSAASLTNLSGSGSLLSNLIIKGDNVTVGNIDTPNVNLVISGADGGLNESGSVTIAGTVKAKNILVTVKNTDSHELSIIDNDLTDDTDDYSVEASLFDIVSDAVISIKAGAFLLAGEAVALTATSEQTKPLIPDLENLLSKYGDEYSDALNINFVSVKVGSAIINILGSISAAAVRADATTKVDISATNKNLAAYGLPLAIGVVVADAGVIVDGNSKITATDGSVVLKADSSVKLETESHSGALPFTLAVSTVVNNAYVDIKGNSKIESKGDTDLSAKGYTEINTISTGTNATTGTTNSSGTSTGNTKGYSGGFFAISVAVQNVYAAIREAASAVTEGSLTSAATAFEHISNKATSNPDEGGGSFTLQNLVAKVTQLLNGSATNSSSGSNGTSQSSQRSTSAFTTIINKLTGTSQSGSTTTGSGVNSLINTGTGGATGSSTSTGSAVTANTSSTQLVGALAVTYAENSNKAYIDTTGTIQSRGILAVKAMGSITNVTLADGSPINRTSMGSTGVTSTTSSAVQTNTTYDVATKGSISFATSENGYLSVDKATSAEQTSGASITVTATPSAGYKLSGITMNGAALTINADGITATFIMPDANAILAATFVPKGYSITCNNANPAQGSFYSSPGYGDEGDTVKIHVTPSAGYSVYEVKATYTSTGAVTTLIAQKQADGTYQLTMPSANVTVTVAFTGDAKTVYLDTITGGSITVKDSQGNVVLTNDTANGIATTEASIQVGAAYTVVITPDQGNYLQNNSLKIGDKIIYADGSGFYKFTMPASTLDRIKLNIQFTSNSSLKQNTTTSRTNSTALGVGVAVAVVNYDNQAYISKGGNTISAGGIEITADTIDASSSTIAKTGFTAADLGLAGALTVHVFSGENSAEIKDGVKEIILEDGSSIIMSANVVKSDFVTVADAAGSGASTSAAVTTSSKTTAQSNKDTVGVGAGIAIGIIGFDNFAKIADPVSIKKASESAALKTLSVKADYTGTERMIARAGASGGTAIVPVLALDVSGIYVAADTGTNKQDSILKFTDGVEITANNSMTRIITADANAVGGSAGAGGSFIVDILNDSATSNLGRSVNTAKTINVNANSVSRLTATGRASASGAVRTQTTTKSGISTSGSGITTGSSSGSALGDSAGTGGDSSDASGSSDPASQTDDDDNSEAMNNLFSEGEADAVADANTNSAASMADIAGTQNVSGNGVKSLTANRQKAETSEGSVQVAATFVLNVQNNTSKAMIADGITVKTADDLTVVSKSDTDGIIQADSSATNSTTGVGVAVAINVVTYNNIAYVGAYNIEAKNLTIDAENVDADTKADADSAVTDLTSVIVNTLGVDKLADALTNAATKYTTLKLYIEALAAERA